MSRQCHIREKFVLDAFPPYIGSMPRHDPIDGKPHSIEVLLALPSRAPSRPRNHSVAASALVKAGEIFAQGGLSADEILRLHRLVSDMREDRFSAASLHRLLDYIANLGGPRSPGSGLALAPVRPRAGGPALDGGAAAALEFDDGDPEDQPAPRRRLH